MQLEGHQKNKLRPHKSDYWCIPSKDDVEFVACMEDVLDVYELPHNPHRPVVCMDEKPYELLGDARQPLPMRPGDDGKIDSEYVRNGTCSIFAFIEPLGRAHHVSVHEHCKATDWAMEIKYLSDVMFPDAEKIILVMDNLNTHKPHLYIKHLNHPMPDKLSSDWKSITPRNMSAGSIWKKLN